MGRQLLLHDDLQHSFRRNDAPQHCTSSLGKCQSIDLTARHLFPNTSIQTAVMIGCTARAPCRHVSILALGKGNVLMTCNFFFSFPGYAHSDCEGAVQCGNVLRRVAPLPDDGE
jgi:hypothetical protein